MTVQRRHFMKFIQLLFCVFIGTGFLWAEQGTETVTLQLKWKHQFQFAGYYAAQQLGYYQAEGFDVKFREITPGRSVFDEVIDGTATFGIADASIVLQRLNGRPVVILTTVFQHSPLVFLTRSEDDILSPYELRGKRVMFQRNDNDASLIAMLTTLGITEDQYTWVPSSYNSRALLDEDIDAMSGYRTNEPFIYDKLDQPVRLLDPINYGIDFYGDLLFARQDYVEQFPQRAKAFAEASLKGWQYTVEHPQQVVDWILEYYGSEKTLDELSFEAQATVPMIAADFVPLGTVLPERFNRIASVYQSVGFADENATLAGLQLENYLKPNNTYNKNWLEFMLMVAAVFLIILLSLWMINRRLAFEVKQRTQALEISNQQLEYLSETDHLTGIANRFKIDAILSEEWHRLERYKAPLSIIIFDLDHFKDVNDKYGHLEGDKVLQNVAALTLRNVRNVDSVGRWGGEEFIVICPSTDAEGAMQVAEKLLEAFREKPILGDIRVTASFGISSSAETTDDLTDLIKQADAALYRAKQNGRNQIQLAG